MARGAEITTLHKPIRWREYVAVALTMLAVLLLLALISYRPEQSPNMEPRARCTNYVGVVGLWAAHELLQTLGIAAYAFPVFMILLAVMIFRRFVFPSVTTVVIRGVVLVVLTVTSACLAQMFMPVRMSGLLNAGESGGILGRWIVTALTARFSVPGTAVILIGLALIEVLFLFDASLRSLARGVWRLGVYAAHGGRYFIRFCGWLGAQVRAGAARLAAAVARVMHRGAPRQRQEPVIVITGEQAARKQRARKTRDRQEPAAAAPTPQEPESAPAPTPAPAPVPPPPTETAPEEDLPPYVIPGIDLLDGADIPNTDEMREATNRAIEKLHATFTQFGIEAQVVNAICGPVITCYEVQPPPGVKVSRITALEDDIALAMKAKSIRIVAPIPGRDAVGIELPNEARRTVMYSELVDSKEYAAAHQKMVMPLALGQTLSGETFLDDLTDMPHLLVAGATGSGKSVCINTILLSLLYRFQPHELKLVLVDPKHVELVPFHNLAHLLVPVLNDPGKVPEALDYLILEMDRRYKYFARLGVRNISMYNARRHERTEPLRVQVGNQEYDLPALLPYIVVVIDELADLMMVAADEIERKIIRLAQLARAAGIHLVLATQRPSTNVITGLIKANIPARIAFRTASGVDSRVIIDEPGSEKLLGKGDMLYKSPTAARTSRIQGAFVSEDEVRRVTAFVRDQRAPQYVELSVLRDNENIPMMEKDGKFEEAVQVVLQSGQASASYLQRVLQVGYARAARLVDLMEAHGIVGPKRGAKPRDILVDEWPPPSAT
jgi:S-DNA-T family DNA segregation ATPase FtsK/SpoIIIE